MKPNCYFLIPLYNEEENIVALATGLKRVAPEMVGFHVRFIFSDDGSTDNSVSLLNEVLRGEDFEVLSASRNGGPGTAFERGFRHIFENEPIQEEDIVVTLEADNTSDLSILSDMVEINRMGYELVLASVYAQGGGFDRTSLTRKILSYGANFLFRAFFEVSVLTLSSFYRVYSVSLLRRVRERDTRFVSEPGFICALELLLKAIECKARIIEVPMTLRSDLRRGASKMKLARTTLAYLRFLLRWRKIRSTDQERPNK